MVSRGDALAWKINGALSETTLAEHVSDASMPFAHPDTPSGEIADLIVDVGIGRIPIIEPGSRRVVGILSRQDRSEEHTSELQSLMRISYAVFCLKKTKNKIVHTNLLSVIMFSW